MHAVVKWFQPFAIIRLQMGETGCCLISLRETGRTALDPLPHISGDIDGMKLVKPAVLVDRSVGLHRAIEIMTFGVNLSVMLPQTRLDFCLCSAWRRDTYVGKRNSGQYHVLQIWISQHGQSRFCWRMTIGQFQITDGF